MPMNNELNVTHRGHMAGHDVPLPFFLAKPRPVMCQTKQLVMSLISQQHMKTKGGD